MKYVDRGAFNLVDGLFASKEGKMNKEALVAFFSFREEKISQSNLTISDWVLSDDDIRSELALLFKKRCAFCESHLRPSPLIEETYRFRPKSEASPVETTANAHLYYLWLADAWQNLYYVCPDCRPENGTYFPVVSENRADLPTEDQLLDYLQQHDGIWPIYSVNERPILVDPCMDQKLWRHFNFFANGEVVGRDRRGRETIEHFSLNRPNLIRERGQAFNRLILSARQLISNRTIDLRPRHLDFNRMLYAGGWQILLRNLLADALEMRPSDNLDNRMERLTMLSDGLNRFDLALKKLWKPNASGVAKRENQQKTFTAIPTEIHIQNFKSLENLSFKLPTRATDQAASLLILGENAVGKSSILEAIAIAMMGEDKRRVLKLTAPKLVLNPRYMGAEGSQAPTQGAVRLTYAENGTQTLELRRDIQGTGDGFQSIGGENTLPIFAYGAFRHYLNAEKRFTRDKYVRSLFHPEHILSNPQKWLLRLSDNDFNMVARALREVFSVEVEFDVLERDQTAKEVYVVAALDDQNTGIKQRTPLSIVSSGFRSVLAVLCDILRGLMDKRINKQFQSLGSARGLVLIDEVESHLHPRWKMSIMAGLRRALPQVTFIATSHDPLCLRGMGKDEVIVLERISGNQSGSDLPVFTQSIVDLPDHEYWTVEQLLTADFFQLRSTATKREKNMAEIERKLAKGERDEQVRAFLKEMSDTLPIGDTEVHRLVQEAIADYLVNQRDLTAEKRTALKAKTKKRILSALEAAR